MAGKIPRAGRDVQIRGQHVVPPLALRLERFRPVEAGLSDFEMRDKVIEDLAAFKDWNGFDQIGEAISHAYLRIEQDLF